MKKILVVDNHPVILKFMEKLLVKEGHEVRTANDGLSALDILKTYYPDVFFIDLVMQNISGDKLCRIIRNYPEHKDAFIVVLSGIAAEGKEIFDDYGADIFIAKGPFNKMARHILKVINLLDTQEAEHLKGKILGYDEIYPRKIIKELLASKRHHEITLNPMSEGLLELILNFKIVYANPAAISLIGIPEEKLLSLNFTELFDKEDCHRLKSFLESAIKSEVPIIMDDSVRLNNKQVSIKIIPIHEKEYHTILVILGDVSKQKQLESQLLQAQKMESIGTLAGGIAHDFKNILFLIAGYTQLTLENLPEGNSCRGNLVEVLDAVERARELIKQILTFSRQSSQEKQLVKIQPITKEVIKMLKSSLPSTIKVIENIDDNCGSVMADPTRIHQVIMNLCTNAYQAMKKRGGVIEISLDEIKVPPEGGNAYPVDMPAGFYVRLTVRDTGCGMDQETVHKVFDPYFTTKEPGEGTGLGLSIVHGIIKSHSGYISIFSEPGKGSIFYIYLPRFVSRSALPKKAFEAPSPTGDERILIVEEELKIAQMLKEMLSPLGYEVEYRISSIEALREFQAHPENFDLVITDLNMPNMTGDELVKAMRHIRPDIPIILCTGFSETITEERMKAIGIREIVKKPAMKSELARVIRRVLDAPQNEENHS